MKILKYFLLLLVLSLVALFVYIATQNGAYTVTRSLFVNAPQSTVYHYVNNLKSWEEWAPWEELDRSSLVYDAVIKGDSAGFSWSGKSGEGSVRTLKAIAKDSLSQRFTLDKNSSTMGWKFKNEAKGTMVTWTIQGSMNIWMKVSSFFKGGAEGIMGEKLDRGLANIKNYFTKELSEFSVDTKGLTVQGETYYIVEKATADTDNLAEEMTNIAQSLIDFVKDNSLTLKGKPFAIIDRTADSATTISFSMCVPIAEEIFTTEDSQVQGRKQESFVSFNTVLKGDYSHIKTAIADTRAAMDKANQQEDFSKKIIFVFEKSILDSRKPSEWITNIYMPLDDKGPALGAVHHTARPITTNSAESEVPQPTMPVQVP
ncbi:SRPBCC family protein [Flavobacterium sp. JP2137]|uniref:SRPBCC family protein n=1 Tax=Flavobacterium sp. JP2137 TaxID=3414510 RepID=UPI003D2FE77D